MKIDKLQGVEYIDIVKNKQCIKTYKPKEVNGLTWREFQVKLGSDLKQSTQFYYIIKFQNENKINKGLVRSVFENAPSDSINQKNDQSNQIADQIKSLQTQINSLGSGGISTELLISITKQSYETQINFLNAELMRKESFISKLESKIEELENELEDCASNDNNTTQLSQYLELAQMFLRGKQGNLKPVTNLKDSDASDIPDEILEILGLVDYSKIAQNDLQQIIQYLKIFIQKLPLKGQP